MQSSSLNKFIIDTREESAFKSLTFSNYRKGDVTKELSICLMSNNYEQCHYWCAELICSGHFEELWDTLISFAGKHINLGNPKLPIYMQMRVDLFRDIARKNRDSDIALRNNMKVRRLFAEVIGVLVTSKNRLCAQRVKVCTSVGEYDLMNMASKLKAPDVSFVKGIFKDDDPKELYIAVNEMGYHLSNLSNDAVEACYWLEWMLEYESQTCKRKDKCVCARRVSESIAEKYQTDIIWLIWDILLCYGSTSSASSVNKNKAVSSSTKTKIVRALCSLFSLRYNSRMKSRRIQLLYFAISIITSSYIENIEIIENKTLINSYADNADLIYKELKKQEKVEEGKEEIAELMCNKILLKNESDSDSSSTSKHKMDILNRGLDMGESRSKTEHTPSSKRKVENHEEMTSMEKSIMKMSILDNVSLSSLSVPKSRHAPKMEVESIPDTGITKEITLTTKTQKF